jgi:hypothetical protein
MPAYLIFGFCNKTQTPFISGKSGQRAQPE